MMKKQKIEITKSKSDMLTDESGDKYFEIKTKGSDALILHPSFCCPVIIEEGKPINIFILAGQDFHDAFGSEVIANPNPLFNEGENTPQFKIGNMVAGAIGGGMIKRHINQMLKITTWDNIDKYSQMKDDPIKPMYSTAEKAETNMSVTYLGEVKKPSGLKDKDDMIFANIRESSFKKYVGDEGLKFLFQIELSNIDHIKQGLYDFSWITYNDKVFDDFSEKEIEDSTDCREFFEKQDQLTRKYICDDEKRKGLTHAYKVDDEFKFETDEKTPIQNHHPVYIVKEGKKKLNIGHLSDVHVSSRQFAFKTSKAKVIPGASDDDSPPIGSMVNVTFNTLRNLMDDLASDTDILIFTGDLIDYGRNYNPKNKFIDNPEAKTGDIWDQMTLDNIDKKFEYGDEAGKEMYPHSIDNVLVYSLFRRHYKKHGKPILLVSGNHECYTLPYGISPRADIAAGAGSTLSPYSNTFAGFVSGLIEGDGFIDSTLKSISGAINGYFDKGDVDIKEVIRKADENRRKDWLKRTAKSAEDKNIEAKKANEGIPADHNLTIYEAIMMYGPDYNIVPMGGFSDDDTAKNFKHENLDWFYNIFTPLEDFAISYNDQQHFIGLGWKDKERFISIGTMGTFGGHLPRSPEAVTNEQLDLIKSAIKNEEGDKILLSHFTFANYDASKGIESEGEINYNNTLRDDSEACTGTFENNRFEVYKMIVKDNKIKYTLSGHSHRNGVYICTNSDSSWVPGRYYFETKALPLDGKNNYESSAGPKIIVSSSGGPNGKQNFDNELFNWTIDYPSGTYIKYDDNGKETIGIIQAKNAKPRFSVALEYADIVGKDQLNQGFGIFRLLKLLGDGDELEVEINKALKIPSDKFINELSLYFTSADENHCFKFTRYKENDGKVYYRAKEKAKWFIKSELFASDGVEYTSYISCRFKELSESYFKHYDFSTPLNIRSQIRDIKDIIIEGYQATMEYITDPGIIRYMEDKLKQDLEKASGYVLNRDPEYGEVVDHYQLSISGGSDFVFDWDKRTDPGK